MDQIKKFKSQSAEKAVEFVRNGMALGLGSGTTTEFAIRKIGQLLHEEKLKNIMAIPSSRKTERLASKLNIPLTDFSEKRRIDLTIDGADEVDPQLNLIKGGGGALLREKIVIQASKKVIIIVDETKLSPCLGTTWAIPVEVLPFGWPATAGFLRSLGAKVKLRKSENGNIYRTDQNNYILDARFGVIRQPEELAARMSQYAGILEHGLFLDMVSDVIVAGQKGINHLKRFDVL